MKLEQASIQTDHVRLDGALLSQLPWMRSFFGALLSQLLWMRSRSVHCSDQHLCLLQLHFTKKKKKLRPELKDVLFPVLRYSSVHNSTNMLRTECK